MERVVTPKNTNVYLEAVEVAENDGREPKKLGMFGWQAYRNGNTCKGYCRKRYSTTYHNK